MLTFTRLVFGSMRRSCAVILLLGTAGSTAGQVPCQVDSSHDGNGLFTYTFHRGDAPGVFRLGTNDTIAMQFYGIRGVEDPPGWSHSISATGAIIWRPSEAPAFLDDPVTFSIRSCLAETATYDNWWPPGQPYPVGTIDGAVYELPGRTNFLEGGYQNFIFTGPARPTLFGEQHASQALLSWSTLAKECQLEYCDVLLPQQIWAPVTNSPSILGTNFTVALPATNLTRMFRLAVLNVR